MDLANNTAGASESPTKHNNTAGASENPTEHNNTEGAFGSPTKHYEGAIGSPINDEASSAEIPLNNEAAGAGIPVTDLSVSSANPGEDKSDDASHVNYQAVSSENLAEDKLDGAENSVEDQMVCEEISDEEDKPDSPINLVNYRADGAEDPPNFKFSSAERPVKELVAGTETPIEDQAGGVNDPAKGPVDSAENPMKRNDGSENSINDTVGDIEISVNDKTGAAENAVDDKSRGIENLANDRADGVESSLNKQAEAAEIPVEVEQWAADIVEHKADPVECPVDRNADRLPAEAKEILISLASKWEDVLDPNALQVIPLKGAMTNVVFQIKWRTKAGETSRKVLVRIYGQGVDVFFDRRDEIRTFEFMSKHGQGPSLLGRFANGRIEEFIHARTLSASDLRDPSISALIAAKMKEFHNLDMPGEKKVHLWDRLRTWLGEAKRLSSPKEVEAFYLDTIDREIFILENELSGAASQRIGFCHNDLQYGNIMLDEETNAVTIIDYEYASYNPVAYDIANHFCEMAANYHTETPHILDYKKYPDIEERRRFVNAYLSSSGAQPNSSEVEELLQEIEKFTLANHLFWGVWGIISAQVNKIDFDYKEYARQRFQEYWARKPYLLSYDTPSPYDAPSPYNNPAGGEVATPQPPPSHARKSSGIFRKMKRVLGLGLFRSNNSKNSST